MITLQLKAQIPSTRHLTLSLDLPDAIQPGEAEIVLIVNTSKNSPASQQLANRRLREKLQKVSVWSEEDLVGFKKFREATNKWQPEEF